MTALRILLVEDDRNSRECIAELLLGEGHEVAPCAHGDDALARLARASYDVLLTDLVMPGMSGLELTGVARARHPSLRCFIMTGQEPSDVPGVGWIVKPIDFDLLLGSLSALAPAP